RTPLSDPPRSPWTSPGTPPPSSKHAATPGTSRSPPAEPAAPPVHRPGGASACAPVPFCRDNSGTVTAAPEWLELRSSRDGRGHMAANSFSQVWQDVFSVQPDPPLWVVIATGAVALLVVVSGGRVWRVAR